MRLAGPKARWALVLALPLVAVAALRANEAEEAAAPERERAARPPQAATTVRSAAASEPLPRIDLQRLQALSRRHASEQPPVDPFAAESAPVSVKEQAAAKREPPPPPPPPEAPQLPFRFIGRQDADGVALFFLEQQLQTHMVRIGEDVADGWRLDAADEQALTFTYVPLGQQRRLATGSAG